jgi:hypothetical protein
MNKLLKEPSRPLRELDPEIASFGALLLHRAAAMSAACVPQHLRENLLRSWRHLRAVERCDCGQTECRSYVFDRRGPSQECNRPQTVAGEFAIIADRDGKVIRLETLAFDNCAPTRAHAYIADGSDWRVVTLAA